ncbi:hypothetical protein DFQ27_008563, partial [Actinomortierella ambigua]
METTTSHLTDQAPGSKDKGSSISASLVSSDNPDALEKGGVSQDGEFVSSPQDGDKDKDKTHNTNSFDQSKKLEGKELKLVILGMMLVVFMASLDQ